MRPAGILIGLLAAALPTPLGSAAVPGLDGALPSRPVRVMSMNLCTDQILLELLPPERIASVTWIARNPAASLMVEEARRVPTNDGQAEEVIRQKPDLVIAGSFTTPAVRGMLKRLNYPMIEVDDAYSLDDVRRVTRQIAAAVGEPARGEVLIARMDGTIAELQRDPAPKMRVAYWDRSGFSASRGTLQDSLLELAGGRNVANEPPASGYAQPDAEVLLQSAPDLLVRGSSAVRTPSLGDDVTLHRVVRRHWGSERMLTIPQAYYVCGTPRVVEAARLLRDQMRRAAAGVALAPLPVRRSQQ